MTIFCPFIHFVHQCFADIEGSLKTPSEKTKSATMYCQKCSYSSNNWFMFKKHVESHEDKSCPRCNKTFSNVLSANQTITKQNSYASKQLCSHLRYCKGPKSPKSDPLICPKCSKKFRHRQSMNHHKKMCGIELKCVNCDTIFSNKIELGRHKRKCPKFTI